MSRPKGSQNKVPKAVADEIVAVWHSMGGRDAMTQWAQSNPDAYYRMWGQLAPKQIQADVTGDLSIQLISHLDNDTPPEFKS